MIYDAYLHLTKPGVFRSMAFTNVKYGFYLLLSVLIIKIYCFNEVLLSSSQSTESKYNLELNTAVLSLQVFPEQKTLPKPLEITFERLNVSESKYLRTQVNLKYICSASAYIF